MNEEQAPLTAMWLRHGLAKATLSLGDRAVAASELRHAVRLAEGLLARFRSEEFRTGFFGEVQDVYELAIEVAMDDGRHAEALELSEMSRARAFADLIRGRIKHAGATPDHALSAVAIAETLPPKTALVVYHVLPDRTAAWVVRGNDQLSGHWLPVGLTQLAESTRLFRKQITEFAAVQDQASVLYKQLIAPLSLQDDEIVVFVPHKSLHFLPLHALRGPKGWLIEERAIATAPSASALASIVGKPSVPADSVLALGNPLLASNDLPPLPGAEVEVERVALKFPTATKYVREAATKARFLTDGPKNSVLHVAAHAQVDEIDPMYSRIRLALSDKAQSDLEAHELYRVNLGEVRLVTLSACDSGLGRVSGGDEFWGFKRTVLGAGARTFLASLWPVVDESTPILMTRFYEGLKKMSGAEALRAGQLELIRSKEYSHPIFWAPFTLVGDWR
jgi:CHAT domain-containing protein